MPPDPVVIFDESGSARTSFVGPYTEGQQVTLICDAFGGEAAKCPMMCESFGVSFLKQELSVFA